ncbi:MAG: hypothetical protein H6765_04135 [Candidatus Peribacteria bacterium]|nr:MAG: hypothetical protein H6765_04135 [Candidatus Peribacteria bacterium]
MDEYLQYDKEDFYFDPIAYPTHIEKKFAYEAGYINSDGYDAVGPTETLTSPDMPTAADNPISPRGRPDVGAPNHPGYTNQFQAAAQDDAACEVDESM